MENQQQGNLPCPRASTGMYYSSEHKKIFIIGGADRENAFNDFWQISIDSNENSQQLVGKEINLQQQPSMFSPRFGHTINIFQNKIFIFGGQNITQEIYNDLFCYDINQEQLTKLTPKNLPPARNSHSSCINENLETIFIYGGANNEGPLNDLHSYNIKSNKFTKIQFNDSGILQGREMHTMHLFSGNIKFEKQDVAMEAAEEFKFEKFKEGKIISADFSVPSQNMSQEQQEVDQKQKQQKNIHQQNIEFQEDQNLSKKNETSSTSSQLIIIGGRTLDQISSQIYLIDSQLDVHIIKTLPQSICSHSSCIYNNCIYIYGGTNGEQFFNDIFIMELNTNNLFKCKIESQLLSQQLSQRIASSMTVINDNILIYGGHELTKANGEFIFIQAEYYSPSQNSQLC